MKQLAPNTINYEKEYERLSKQVETLTFENTDLTDTLYRKEKQIKHLNTLIDHQNTILTNYNIIVNNLKEEIYQYKMGKKL